MSQNKDTNSSISLDETSQIEYVLAQYHQIADELHDSNSRNQAVEALSPINELPESTQMALLKALSKEHHTDAADILLAIYELSPYKAVHKEARRSLIRLAGAKIHSSWTPTEDAAPVATTNAPRFWKGVVTQMREEGQLQLVLCFEQGYEYSEGRMFSFLLDYWREGVKDFFHEEGGKRNIESKLQQLKVIFSGEELDTKIKNVDCTLAEGRRLLEEALSVNKWRGTKPYEEFRRYQPSIQQLILNATDLGVDRGYTFINPDLEPDEIVANFIGGWSLGDYGLCYDLLANDSNLREALPRNEWLELRRKWNDEAQPARMEPNFIREREHNQQSIWLPTSIISSRAATKKEVEAGWSLELADTQLSGTLPEMPLGTAVNKGTRRHWFWTSYSLVQEDDVWRISSMTDEGASAQGLTISDLQSRLTEHDKRIQELIKTHAPNSPDSQEAFEEVIRRMIQSMHYDDALIVKLPLDRKIYEDAFSRATGIGMVERAIVYLERLAEIFTVNRAVVLQQLGASQASLSDLFYERGMDERSKEYAQLAEESLRQALTIDDRPLGHILLAELLSTQDKFEEAKDHLMQARALNPTSAEDLQIESDLGDITMDREQYDEAVRHYQRVADLEPNRDKIWFKIGLAYRRQKNFTDAEQSYLRAIEMQPADFMPYSELAAIYLTNNQLNRAQEILEQGLRAIPNSAHLRALLASVLFEKGDLRRAQAYLQEAESISPDLEIVQATRQLMDANKTKKK